MGSAQLMMDAQGTPTKIPVDNPHRNSIASFQTPHLSDSLLPGSQRFGVVSVRQSKCLPAFEIVFSQWSTHAQSSNAFEMPPTLLAWASAHTSTSGVNSQDPRAAVKVTGE